MHRSPRSAWLPLLCLAIVLVGGVDAGERQRAGGFSTDRGHSGTWQTQRSGTLADGLTRQRSITGDNGRSANTSSTTRYDAATGQFSRTTSGADGRSRSVEATRQDGQTSGTWSTADGKSGTFTQQSQRADDGSLSHQVQVTNANGETVERSAGYSLDRDSGTLTRSVTGPQGNTRSGSVTLTPTP